MKYIEEDFSLILKQGDLEPPIIANLVYEDGTLIPLDTVETIRFIMTEKRNRNNVYIDTDDVKILDKQSSQIKYQWVPGDTEFYGEYQIHFVVNLKSGKQITIPNKGYEYIYIDRALGRKLEPGTFPKVIVKYEEFLPDREIKYLKSLGYNVQLVCIKYEDLDFGFKYSFALGDNLLEELKIKYNLSFDFIDQIE